jgi:hypothetical protein
MATIAQLAERVLRRLGVAVVPVADRPALVAVVSVAEIAQRALIALGVIAADEAATALDTALAQGRVAAVHDGLVAQGIVSWASSAIPQAVSDDYTLLAALHLASSFGKTADPTQEPVREAHIRRVSLLMTAPAVAEQALLDVHTSLDARGRTRWSVGSIPDFAEGPYTALAANIVAPTFGLPQDPNAEARAMRELVQATALPTSGETLRGTYF